MVDHEHTSHPDLPHHCQACGAVEVGARLDGKLVSAIIFEHTTDWDPEAQQEVYTQHVHVHFDGSDKRVTKQLV